jgi:hypothetical protein
MRLTVVDHFNDGLRRYFDGDEAEVAKAVGHAYPWLVRKFGPGAPLAALIEALDRSQAYSAVSSDADLRLVDLGKSESIVAAMLGTNAALERALEAARFLASAPPPSPEALRAALRAADEDPEMAALIAVGLDPSPSGLKALRGVLSATPLRKSEKVALREIVPATEDGEKFAAAVARAAEGEQVEPIVLGGKHSDGTMVARDPETGRAYLLKPGSGPQNPAAGENEVAASQSKREAAFSALARLWGLGDFVPEAHLLLIDGREYAAMQLLGHDFKNFNQIKASDPGLPRRTFTLYLADGMLHKWAILDYVAGQVDRNAGNVMARGDEVKLIDAGSAFAGDDFSPATDRSTFVPYYLRALAPDDFQSLSPQQAHAALPRLHGTSDEALKAWLLALDPAALAAPLARYGIDPGPAERRLAALQGAARHTAADAAVNAAWTVP